MLPISAQGKPVLAMRCNDNKISTRIIVLHVTDLGPVMINNGKA